MLGRYFRLLQPVNKSLSSRYFASVSQEFELAQLKMKTINEGPSNEEKLQVYALYKQATVGDVTGKRPGMMDFVGRAKYDAWAKHKNTTSVGSNCRFLEICKVSLLVFLFVYFSWL